MKALLVMGSIRVLLAFAVVCAHSGVPFGAGGKLAVQLFYMISGFLMSFILTQKRSYISKWDFYKSRFLRIYPVYVIVFIFSLFGYLLFMPHWFDKFYSLPAAALALLWISQLTLFGLDILMFTGVTDGNFHFVTNFMTSTPPLFTCIAVPQAWTLSLELYFYLFAPIILTRPPVVVGLLAASLALRLVLTWVGVGAHDPWNYRFFPTELALFLGGAVSHRYLLPLIVRHVSLSTVNLTCSAFFILLAPYTAIPGIEWVKELSVFVLMIGALPLLFTFQNTHQWDAMLGNLSYPVYVSHMFVLHVSRIVLPKLGIFDKVASISFAYFAMVAVAYILNKFIAEPVDVWRGRFRSVAK